MPPSEVRDVTLILFGIWIWDYVTSFWFEYRLFTVKNLRFRWEFVPYFLTRYIILAYITIIAVKSFIDVTALPVCTHAALINSVLPLGFIAIAFSTWNLLTRTIIIWGYHPLVMKLLFAVGLIHFVISLIVSFAGRPPCDRDPPSTVNVAIFGISTVVIEFTILVVSLVGIRRASQHRETQLARLLKTQGVAYFAMVVLVHTTVVLAHFLSDNGVAGMCAGTIGTVLAPLLSCRLVTSTLSQGYHADSNAETRMHRIDCFELSEDPSQSPSAGRMTTCIDVTKDNRSVC